MSEEVGSLSYEALGEFLLSKGIDSSVATKILDNRIDGELFVELEEIDLTEIAPVLGDRMRLRKILNTVRNSVRKFVEVVDYTVNFKTTQDRSMLDLSSVSNADVMAMVEPSPLSSATANSSTDDGVPCNAVQMSSSSNWHLAFAIPELSTFSDSVKDAVRTGVTTSKARREITQVLRTYITAHTFYPKPEQYTTVCKKLVEKYPKLCDDVSSGSYYVSQ